MSKKKVGSKEKVVRDYVLKEEKKGFNIDQIKTRLLDAGYPESEVNTAIKKYHLDDVKESQKATVSMETYSAKPKRKPNFKMILAVLGITLAVLLIVLWLLIPSVKNCGTDQQCFIDYANKCEPAKYTQTTEGTLFKYAADMDVMVDENCKLTKMVDKLDSSESPEIKELFEGKGMVCSYTLGNFNSEWITTITKGLDGCEGQLKIAIYEMIIALYELAEEGY